METAINFFQEIVSLIKEKPELASLSDEYVSFLLQKHISAKQINQLAKYTSFKQCKRSSVSKELITQIRRELREVYGVFVKHPLNDFKKRIKSISSYKDPLIDIILQKHQSTVERFEYYPTFYELLFDRLFAMGLPKKYTLLDLACGYNPFSYKYLFVKPAKYISVDLAPLDAAVINTFFSQTGISGDAFAFDLLSETAKNWLSTQKPTLCFLFKALDSLESLTRHSSKALLASLRADFLVVTFSLVTIGGKNHIATSKRLWFEHFCTAQNWLFERLETPNELIYLIKVKR